MEAITDLRVIVTLNSIECVLQQPIFCPSSRKYVLLYQALEFDNDQSQWIVDITPIEQASTLTKHAFGICLTQFRLLYFHIFNGI